ncbi:MAG: metallophosphoesterase family protein [Promethearchaeota archaeon]|jgi:UDP-2,3-diacylglucosamine pyrophosphatase LpxH
MVELKPKILIVSDIHITALKSRLDLFIQFLNDIQKGELGDQLQVLIILGDFIDLCVSTPKKFLVDENAKTIFELLLMIKKKVNLIFVPGNHEIPITSNVFTENYDEKFEKRKSKFLRKFKKSIVGEVFTRENVCQYILLKKLKGVDMLLLYNSQDQIYKSPINKIKINGINLAEGYSCLMMHGYQFDSEVYRFFTGQIWKSLISYHNTEVKEAFNYFWNVVIKEHRKVKPIIFEDMKLELARHKNISLDDVETLFVNLNSLEFNMVKLNMRILKRWERSREYSYYLNGIKEFFEEAECNLSEINHIIYGHSHIKGVSSENINNQMIEIINDGAWQHSNPSYAEILYRGKINLKSLNL